MNLSILDIRTVLGIPSVYSCFVKIIGGRSRFRYIQEYVRPRAGDRILDIGCGPGEILDWLEDVEYVGVDSCQAYIDSATRHYGDRATFLRKTVGRDSLDESSPFDIVLATGLVHHLNDRDASSLFQLARSVLRSGGRLVTLDPCRLEKQSPIARFLISIDRGEYVRSREQYLNLATAVFTDTKISILRDLVRIPYTHIIMECVI